MDKPEKYLPEPKYRYNLGDVLEYIDKQVPRFKRKVWHELVELGYINNGTSKFISFREMFGDSEDWDICDELEVLYDEFPDIASEGILFDISW